MSYLRLSVAQRTPRELRTATQQRLINEHRRSLGWEESALDPIPEDRPTVIGEAYRTGQRIARGNLDAVRALDAGRVAS
ncbi:MAG: hypothetical protein AAFP15_01200 [Bacteroidota bacterium]